MFDKPDPADRPMVKATVTWANGLVSRFMLNADSPALALLNSPEYRTRTGLQSVLVEGIRR